MRAYTALAASIEYCYEQKRSSFTALLCPVSAREEAMAALADIRQQRPGASHYCWAYVLGDAAQPLGVAFNDDGEPGGTAGRPMLNVLQQRGVGDCLAVVVRVFGGVKLGAGGLVRAYSAAVSGAVDSARLHTVTPTVAVSLEVDFALEERVRHLLAARGIEVGEVHYGERVQLGVSMPCADIEVLEQELTQATAGNLLWRVKE